MAQPLADLPLRSHAWAGRAGEFLLVGGATPILFALAWLLRKSIGLDASELAVGFLMFHGAHIINDPHFAVTYLLFYKGGRARAFGREFEPLHSLVSRHPRFTKPDEAALGPTPYFAAIFALLNIHHYFMDYVIWRRENPQTRYLFATAQRSI